MHNVDSRCYRTLLLILVSVVISACGTPAPLGQTDATPSTAPANVPTPTAVVSPIASPALPTTPPATPSPVTGFVEGQQITTMPSTTFDLWVSSEGGDRVTERPKLHGSAALTILKIMPTAVQVRTPEGVEGWIRQPITEVAAPDTSVSGDVTRFGPGVRVQISLPSGIPLRQDPSSTAAKLREQIAAGQQATMQELRGDWLKLTLDDGLEGWGRWYYDGEQYIVPPTIQGSIRWRGQTPYSSPATLYVHLKKAHGAGEPQTIAQQTIQNVGFETGLGAGVPFALFANEAVDPSAAYSVSAHVDVDGDGQANGVDYRADEPLTNPTQQYFIPATLLVEPITPSPAPSFPATITVAGNVKVGVERPIPPNAELVVQLQLWADSGLGGPSIIDEQVLPLSTGGTFPFTLETPSKNVPEALANLMMYELFAEVRAPGRLPWSTSYPIAIQQPPLDAELVIEAPKNISTITGSVVIPTTAALPSDAALTIRVVSEVGLDPIGVGKLVIPSVKAGTIPFTLEYPGLAIDPAQTYSIHAEVRAGGKLPLVSALYPVFTKGGGNQVNVVLAPPQEIVTITGVATYPTTSPLPPNAVFTFKLQDATGADGPEIILVEDTITPVGPSPITFSIEYDPALIDQRHTYALAAKIEAGDSLLFANEMFYSVLTQGAPTNIMMTLKQFP